MPKRANPEEPFTAGTASGAPRSSLFRWLGRFAVRFRFLIVTPPVLAQRSSQAPSSRATFRPPSLWRAGPEAGFPRPTRLLSRESRRPQARSMGCFGL